jgi:hypothetical protein
VGDVFGDMVDGHVVLKSDALKLMVARPATIKICAGIPQENFLLTNLVGKLKI